MTDAPRTAPITPQRKFTDPIDSGTVLKHARWTGIATIALAGLGLAVAPNATLLSLGIAGAGLAVHRKAAAKEKQMREQAKVLGAKRTYELETAAEPEIPTPKNDDGTPDLNKETPYWEPEGVCYEKIKSSESIRKGDQTIREPWYHWQVIEKHLGKYAQQEEWLKNTHPHRWAVCRYWWLVGFVVPALRRRHPGRMFRLVSEPVTNGVAESSSSGSAPDVPVDVDPPAAGVSRTVEVIKARSWIVRQRPDGSSDETPWEEVPKDWVAEVVKDYQYHRYIAIRLALQPMVWSRRRERRPEQRPLANLMSGLLDAHGGIKPKDIQSLPDELRVKFPVYSKVSFGRGVEWDRRHCKALIEQQMFDKSSVVTSNPDDGDPRIFGVVEHEAKPIFLPEKWLEQHGYVGGASGTGKTCFVDVLMVQAIRTGFPVLFIDPKGTRKTLNRFYYETRKYGRGHRTHFFHFNDPSNPFVSHYNPLFVYDDPSELASRIASVILDSKDPFWKETGLALAQRVTTLSSYCLKFLQHIGAQKHGDQTVLYPRYQDVPPMIILALAYLREVPNASPKEADGEIKRILAERHKGRWVAKTNVEVAIKEVLDGWWCPYVWNPAMKPVNAYGVAMPELLVGWAIKVVYFHLWATKIPIDRPEADLVTPRAKRAKEADSGNQALQMSKQAVMPKPAHAAARGSRSEVDLIDLLTTRNPKDVPIENILGMNPTKASGGNEKANQCWMAAFRAFRNNHPLIDREGSDFCDRRIVDFYNYFVPESVLPSSVAKEIINFFGEALESMWAVACQNRSEFQKHMTTLQSSLLKFEGQRDAIISSVDPDLILRQLVRRRECAYFFMNYMKDTNAVKGMSRIIIADGLSYLGGVTGNSAKGKYDFYLICDEASNVLSELINPIIAMGRSCGVRAMLMMQNKVDLQVALNDQSKAEQILGNLSLKIQLRTENIADAKLISEKAGEVRVEIEDSMGRSLTPGKGDAGLKTIEGHSHTVNTGTRLEKVPLIDTSAMFSLPKGHAFMVAFGNKYLVVQGLLPEAPCNIIEEFNSIHYDPDENEVRPPIVGRQLDEYATTAAQLDELMPRTPMIGELSHDPNINHRSPANQPRQQSGSGHGSGGDDLRGNQMRGIAEPQASQVHDSLERSEDHASQAEPPAEPQSGAANVQVAAIEDDGLQER